MALDPDLPATVRRLITIALLSTDHAELLYHLRQAGSTTAEGLVALTRLEPRVVARILADLEGAGVVVAREGAYAVAESARERVMVEDFVAVYNERPAALLRAVYARASPVRTFADAFRIRSDD